MMRMRREVDKGHCGGGGLCGWGNTRVRRSFISDLCVSVWWPIMAGRINLLTLFLLSGSLSLASSPPQGNGSRKEHTVLVSILVRNKEHILPFFLTTFQMLNYPKERLALWIRSDHNIDSSDEVIRKWLKEYGHLYHSVNVTYGGPETHYEGEEGIGDWTISRNAHVISLREEALQQARTIWADYLWALDCDVFMTEPDSLMNLIGKNLPIVAPMLKSGGLYSNFWCGMSEDYYYVRTEEYAPIVNRKKTGCHQVVMVHSSVLVDLRLKESDILTYVPDALEGYKAPHDDIITFALSANLSGLGMTVCNDIVYGYTMVPLEKTDDVSYDLLQLRNLKLEVLVDGPPLESSELLQPHVKSLVEGFLPLDETFMISLRRRPERRARMIKSFEELQMKYTIIDAVDGKLLTDEYLEKSGFKLIPGYKDPYHKRPMKRGEIGCFLSHYTVWEQISNRELQVSLILEDDVRFEPFFNQKMRALLTELENLQFKWDLVFIGRKRLQEKKEKLVEGSQTLVHVSYSYWTIGYLLSLEGARKLLKPNPLKKILPVDEYLPIMFDQHPEEEWKSYFPDRNLVALSAEPLLIYPAHYLYEEGYVSDTEDSPTITTSPNPEL